MKQRYYPFSYQYDKQDFLAFVNDYRENYISCVDDMRENSPEVFKRCKTYEENNVYFLLDFCNLINSIGRLDTRAAQDFGNVVKEFIFYRSVAVMAAENAPINEETGLSENSDLFYSATQKYSNAIDHIKALYIGRKYEQQARLIATILDQYWDKLTEETTREHYEDAE